MPATKQKIQDVIEKYGKKTGDTGSPEVQIAVLTEEILNLTKHLQKNKQDFSSKGGLIIKVASRRKLLKYLEKTSTRSYKKIVEDLKL